MTHQTIDRFDGQFSFLSNFHPSTVRFEGRLWKTVEHAFQGAKTLDQIHRDLIMNAPTPGMAKKLGSIVPLRSDWEDIRLSVMETLVWEKFENPFLRPLLLATGDAELVEGNHWHDDFWGIYKGSGENHLGKILMRVREKINRDLASEMLPGQSKEPIA
jgi:ribA/ribD-fused uncharacterized protein